MTIDGAKVEPREAYVQAGAIRLHYLNWGEGQRTLVCLHGTGGSAWHWEPLARTLAPRDYRVVAFDQRGHGDSDQPASGYEVERFVADLEAALPNLELVSFDLLGASLGSRVALVYAAQHPERVGKLVLVDLSFEMPEVEQQRMIDGHKNRPDSFESLEEVINWSRNQPGRWRWTPELHAELAAHEVKLRPDGHWAWRYSRSAAIQGLQAAKQDLWPFARSLEMPTLLVRGAESPVLPSETADQMAEAIPRCRLVVIEEAGHGIPRDNPRAFNQAVGEFLCG